MTTFLAPPRTVLRSALNAATHGEAGLSICFVTSTQLRLFGELDVESADVIAACAEHLERLGATEVTIDLGELVFLDTAGATLLSELGHTLVERGVRLVITRPGAQPRRLLSLAAAIRPLSFEIAA